MFNYAYTQALGEAVQYGMGQPRLFGPLTKWTVTPRGHLLYNNKPVADVRYKEAKKQIEFMLAALNAAEENR